MLASGLFLLGMLMSFGADLRLRRLPSASWREGSFAAAGVGIVFMACVAALR